MPKPETTQRVIDKNALCEDITAAKTRVYDVGAPTPIVTLPKPVDAAPDYDIFLKREDLGPINAYKWRGAYNAVFNHHQKTGCQNIVAASAGNHAQGVALAAKALQLKAKIFMPVTAPKMKQDAVRRHGGDNVEIILTGDTYNEAGAAAKTYASEHDVMMIHPFDDLYTIAGQASIGEEILNDPHAPFDYVFLQIGGGGMASGVSFWLKKHMPNIKIIGVEGVDQASMSASVTAKDVTTLPQVDAFCDGTAVARPGDLTFEICCETIDDFITVTNEEVSAAMARTWNGLRLIPEPSGAMGLAGLLKYAGLHKRDVTGKKLLSIICGANMDFGKLGAIAQRSAIGTQRRHYLRFHIDEKSGGLLNLLEQHFSDISVSDFLYGKTSEDKAFPVIGVETAPEKMAAFQNRLTQSGVHFEDVTMDTDIRYKIINYNPALFQNPLLMHVHFPERKGALREFLRHVSTHANLCYFNYTYSGEIIGRALMGFEFETPAAKQAFLVSIQKTAVTCKPVEDNVAARMLQHG